MKICGLIVEYNPMTNGHLYHLKQAQQLTQADLLVAVMSGNFTQRGEPAIIDKWQRSKAAIDNGIDLVIELPFAFACESADYFAKGAIEILHALSTNVIVFGSETLKADDLHQMALVSQSPHYQRAVESYLKNGHSYPQATAKAFGQSGIYHPNDLLGLAYAKEIIKQKAAIDMITIQRTNLYHDTIEGSSASSIRQRLKQGLSIEHLTPMKIAGYLHDSEELFEPLYERLLLAPVEDLQQIHLVSEGIEYRLKEAIIHSRSLAEFLSFVASRRYPTPRLLRMLVHILLNDKSPSRKDEQVAYLRILGASAKGQQALKTLKINCPLPFISRFAELKHPHLELELQAAKLYALPYPAAKRQTIIRQEYASIPYFSSH